MRVSRNVVLSMSAALMLGAAIVGPSWAHEDHPKVSVDETEREVQTSLAELAPTDRAAAEAQRWCPVRPDARLGAMGKPVKIVLEGKPVFLCCAECEKQARANAKATLAKVEKLRKFTAAVAKLPAADRKVADAQHYCAVQLKNDLGSMGTPVKVMLEGQPVFLCCAGCKKAALANPKAILAKLKERNSTSDHEHHN